MQITISGQHLDITPALREYVSDKMSRISRHFDHVTTAHVVLHVEKQRHLAEATMNTRGATLHAGGEASDMYAAIDALSDKLNRQVIKHKEKRGNRHHNRTALKEQTSK